MSKKIGITVTDTVFEILEERSKVQGRNPSNLASFFVEYCIIHDIATIRPDPKEGDTLSGKFLKGLASGEVKVANGELIQLAHQLGIAVEDLVKLKIELTKANVKNPSPE